MLIANKGKLVLLDRVKLFEREKHNPFKEGTAGVSCLLGSYAEIALYPKDRRRGFRRKDFVFSF